MTIASNITGDARYSVQREYCGYSSPRYVVRFCGDWVGQCVKKHRALDIANEHRAEFVTRMVTKEFAIKKGWTTRD